MALKIKQKAGIMILMRAAARQCAIAIKGPVPNSVPGLLAGLREVVGNCPAFDPHANQFVGVRLGSPRSAAGAHRIVRGPELQLGISRERSARGTQFATSPEISGRARSRSILPDESRQVGSPPGGLLALPRLLLALVARGSLPLSLACHGSFHLDFGAHPRMDAALKKMFTFREARD